MKQRRLSPSCRRFLQGSCVVVPVALFVVVTALVFAPAAGGQTSTSRESPKTRKKPAQPPAWQALDAVRTKLDLDPAIAYVKAHPGEFDDSMLAYNTGFSLEPFIKANQTDSAKLKEKLAALNDAFAAVPPNGRTNYYWSVASELLKHDALLEMAEDVARKSVDEITKDSYIAAARDEHQRYQKLRAEMAQKDKNIAPPEPFDEADTIDRYQMEMSRRLTLLGRIEIKLNHKESAERDLRRALDFQSNSSALLNLAKLALERGDKDQGLSLFTRAYLRGQLSIDEVKEFKTLYFQMHPGNEEDLTRYLDDEYAKNFTNPAKFSAYTPDSNGTKNVALAEVFTGAGCESCVSVDLSADAMLKRYSRNEFVLLTYQTSAPTNDPLSNRTVELREKYYNTGGSAPHTFIDGREIHAEGEARLTQEVLEKLDAVVDKQLDSAPDATLDVHAVRSGNQVHVEVKGQTAKPTESARLQVMLIETEVTYSGENGLRYHPMVVRAAGRSSDAEMGFPIKGTNFRNECIFDLDQVTADNLSWYDQYLDALRKRVPPGFDVGGFREKKNVMDPSRLAVVVFLQDDKSKDILQTSFVPLETRSAATAGDSGHGL